LPVLATINSCATLAAASEGSVQRFGNVNSDVLSPLIILYPMYMCELQRTKAEISNTRWVTARNNYVMLQNYASVRQYSKRIAFYLFTVVRTGCLYSRDNCNMLAKIILYTRLGFRRLLRAYNWLSGISLRSYAPVSYGR